jgi:hypothetical protein
MKKGCGDHKRPDIATAPNGGYARIEVGKLRLDAT